MKVYYSKCYINRKLDFDTVSKADTVYNITKRALPQVQFRPPMPLTATLLRTHHYDKYVNAIIDGTPIDLAESSGLEWTTDTWDSVTYSNGGVLAAANTALYDGVSGTLSSGLHHAHRGSGAGFCTFNGLAIAANEMSYRGSRNVLIIDVDAHCGGGTVSMTEDNINVYQFDLSTSALDRYEDAERRRVFMADGNDYLNQLDTMLYHIDSLGVNFGLCLYNAGVDSHECCMVGGAEGVTTEVLAERDRTVFRWCKQNKIPVAFTLAGGYAGKDLSAKALANLHMNTIREALTNT